MGDTNRPTPDQVIAYLYNRSDGRTMPGAVRMTTAARDYLVELRAELEQVKRERDALIEDFVDYVTGGVPNPASFCKTRCDKCTYMRGWCRGKNCNGFYPSGASGQKEDGT